MSSFTICKHCGRQLDEGQLQCVFCGGTNYGQLHKIRYATYSLLIYYGVSLLLVALYQYSGWFEESYSSLIAFDIIVSLFTLLFVYDQWQEIRKLLRVQSVAWGQLLLIVAIAIAMAVMVSWLADYLNETIYHRKHQVSFIFWETNYPRLLTLIFICLQPAIIEELAYRGLVFGYIKTMKQEPRWAIIGSAFLFSALHFSLLGWLWLMPLGILLAYYRWRNKSLWYGIIAHFCYNFVIVWWEW